MSLRIHSSVGSIVAQRHIEAASLRTEHALKALASGKRIVSPGDDAAGLAISENLRAQMSGLKSAKINAAGAVSLIQVAEGGLSEQTNVIVRLRELAIQASSDNVSDVERGYLQEEYENMLQEFDRIANTTRYGQQYLLSGSGEQFEFQVGPDAGEENIVRYSLNSDSRSYSIGINGTRVDDQDDAREALEYIDEGLTKLSGIRAHFGAFQSRFQAAINNLDVQHENIASARSRISDADIAYESSELASAQVQQMAALAVLAQANTLPEKATRLINQI